MYKGTITSVGFPLFGKRILFVATFLFAFLFLKVENRAFAQGEANFWYFGYNDGLDFNGGAPVEVTNGQLQTDEGSSSISDAAGNLLFYTDGITVYNKNHVQMPNGFGLTGNSTSTQSALIIQKPGSATIYYIFTADGIAGANGIRYNEVDMTLNAGLGDITVNKNILLNTPSCEKIVGIRHCNNKDVWVVTHDWNSDAFRTYLVTAAGVNTTPVMSNAGLVVSGSINNTIGHLKGSPDGKKLASAIFDPINRFELFDFNNSTGSVSNAILFPQFSGTSGAYGVEFSPDGTKLYGSFEFSSNIYQFDLCAGSNTAIENSGVLIGVSSYSVNGSLQLGPDKKIYFARWIAPWLGVINNPNTLGVACNYVDNGVSLAVPNNAIGLPNFVSYYFKQPLPPFTASINCLAGTFATPTVNITNCSGSTNAITSVSWNFGDPASGASNTSTSNNPSHTFTGAGTYTVTLILNTPCSDTLRQAITVVSCGFTASATSTSIACTGQCTGTASATVSAGTGPYTYSWNTTPIETTQQVTGLCAGDYTVTVTDATPTTTTATVTIIEPAVLAAAATFTAATCGGNNGSATVTASGGTSGYTYSWNASPVQTTQTATGLGAGSYTATVTDANGCTQTQTVAITSSGTFSVSTSSTQAGCTVNNGTATATGSNGATPYSYVWNNGQATQTATGLAAGNYTVTVSDAAGCTQTQTVAITSSGTFSTSASSTQAGCTVNNGSATVTASGGTPGYTYSWNATPVQTTQTATGLGAGNYTVTVTDANGCTQTQTVAITSSGTFSVSTSSTQAGCTVNNGTAMATGSNGTAPYSYLWSNGQAAQTATGLGAGNYTVTVTDVAGCTQTQTVAITSSGTFNVSASSTQAGCTVNNGTAMATGSSGTTPYSYLWNNGQATQTATGLAAGNYTVTVTDANGCIGTQTTTVTFSNTLLVSASSTQAGCTVNNGTATATGSSGTTPYNYLWNNGQASQTATGLATGNYTATVTDAAGCTGTQTVNVTQTTGPAAVAAASPTGILPGNSTTLSVTGGTTYQWSPSGNLSCISCQNPVATPTANTIYCVTVTDANNCTATDCVTITILEEPLDCNNAGAFYLPNAFSPNADAENDLLKIYYDPRCIKTFKLIIYDRWGEKVYETTNPTFTWDGSYKGKPQTTAVFVYSLEAEFINGEQISRKGNISMVK